MSDKVRREVRSTAQEMDIFTAYGISRYGTFSAFAVTAMKAEIRRHSRNADWVAILDASEAGELSRLAAMLAKKTGGSHEEDHDDRDAGRSFGEHCICKGMD